MRYEKRTASGRERQDKSESQEARMLARIEVSRGTVERLEDLPPKSIALDGYVSGPAVDTENQRFSFDHHGECVRLVTRATCQQIMDALLLGFDPKGYTIYVNDVDGDTALSVWLLNNPSRVFETDVRKLVESVGMIDAHGPAYPVESPATADAFYKGALGFLSDLHRKKEYAHADLEEVLATSLKNIDALLDGTLGWEAKPERKRNFEVTHEGDGWVMARSDSFIFDLLYKNGYTKAIAYMQQEDGSFRYTVGKKSDLVDGFSVPTILKALNERERGWGGGSTIGGSPRNNDGSASRITPDEVFAVVEEIIAGDNKE